MGLAIWATGSFTSAVFSWSMKLTHMMKYISSCMTTSSIAVRSGSLLLRPPRPPWLIAYLPGQGSRAAASLGRLDGGAAGGAGVGGGGGRAGARLGVVVHLRQQVVGDVGRLHRDAGDAVAE